MSEEKKGVRSTWVYRAARVVAAALTHTITPLTVHGAENIPDDAPFMIIANHQTFYDVVTIVHAVKKHEISFLGKKELTKVGILKWFFSNMHMIPVDRGNSDMAALRTCMKTLRDGGVLGIFPEGTRHKQGVMEDLESGTALIALRSNVPVIPMLITPKFRFFRRMHLYVGTPIEYQDLRAEGINSATCNALCTRITERYHDMVKQYGSP